MWHQLYIDRRPSGISILFSVLIAVFCSHAYAMEFGHGGASAPCRDPEACAFWVEAKGEILPTTAEDFADYLKASKFPYSTIRFNSLGGDLKAAIRLGAMLRELGFTAEADLCASACLYAFMGGVERKLVGQSPKLGIHRFYREKAVLAPTAKQFSGEDLDSTQRLMAGLMLYTHQMGVDLRLIAFSAEAGPSEMRWLTRDEANQLKVTYLPRKWMPWRLEVPKNGTRGLVAISETQDKSKSMQILCSTNGGGWFNLLDETGDAGWFEQCRSAVPYHPVLGTRIPSKNVFVIRNPAPGISFSLPNRGVSFTKASLFSFSDSDNYSMACTDLDGGYSGTNEGLSQMAKLALKNCLD